MLLLYDVRGLEYVSESMFISREIVKDVPSICIIDNDEFKIDSLTGNSQQVYQTNVMLVQRQSTEHKTTLEKISHSEKRQKFLKKIERKSQRIDQSYKIHHIQRCKLRTSCLQIYRSTYRWLFTIGETKCDICFSKS